MPDKIKFKVPECFEDLNKMLEFQAKEREKYYGKSKFALSLAKKLESLKSNENIIINIKGEQRQGMSSIAYQFKDVFKCPPPHNETKLREIKVKK